jgi:protein TonB
MPKAWNSRSRPRLSLALAVATGVHLVWVFGFNFELELAAPPRIQRNLEVMVVRQSRPPESAKEPDFLAQTSQQGGGSETEKRRPTRPDIPPPRAAREPEPVPAESPPPAPPEPPPPAPRVISAERSQPKLAPQAAPKPPPSPIRRELPSVSELLASRRQEADRITAELARKTELHAKRPRRKHISASTQEYKYAAYLDAWRRKVERIGNLNYPQEAKQRNLYGNLVLTVSLRADGSVDRVRLLRSSGHQLLDDSAIRIVRLAAPYAPFPAEIRQETDLLDITRTWQFQSSKQLFTSD